MKKGANPNEQARIREFAKDGVSVDKISKMLNIDPKVVTSFAEGSRPSETGSTAKQLIEQIATMESGDELAALTLDSRKTVAEAAQARVKELEEADKGGL